MSHDYYTWSFPPDHLSRSDLAQIYHGLLLASGAQCFEFTPHDLKQDSIAVTSNDSPEEVMNRLGPGLFAYRFRRQELECWFVARGFNEAPYAVAMICSEAAMRSRQETDFLPAYLELITKLHVATSSLRTILGWELGETVQFDARAERRRLQEGVVEGIYWLDLLQKSLMSESRKARLQSRASNSGAVLTTLANGDWSIRAALSSLAGL